MLMLEMILYLWQYLLEHSVPTLSGPFSQMIISHILHLLVWDGFRLRKMYVAG